jgi:serine/threonine protein kinase
MPIQRLFRRSRGEPVTLRGGSDSYLLYLGDQRDTLKGAGELGSTHIGYRISDGSRVVVKRFHPHLSSLPAYADRIEREAEVTPQCSSLSTELIRQDGVTCLVRDHLDGISLRHLMEARYRRKLSTGAYITLFTAALEALEKVHRAGYIHCDIRPENIMVTHFNHRQPGETMVHIIDFGLSRYPGELHDNYTDKLPFALFYGAPEQMLNFPSLTGFHTDVYAMAITLWEVMACRRPWEEDIPPKVMHLQLTRPLPPDQRIPNQVFEVLSKASSKTELPKPPQQYSSNELREHLTIAIQNRYTSANAMRKALIESCSSL